MNISLLDQTKKGQHNSYGEVVRLSNELRATFNCEAADYFDFMSWLNNPAIKKSQVLFWFVIRIMAWRFPTKHTEIRNKLAERRRLEFDLILSQMKKEVEWVGTVGYQNMVRLDGSLTHPRRRTIKLNNDQYKVINL